VKSFVETVRKSKIKHPTQRGFDPQVWRDVSHSAAHDTTDQNLALAGLFVFQEMEALRKQIEECFPPSSSRESNLRYFVGLENRNFLTINSHAQAPVTSTEPMHVSMPFLRSVPGTLTGERLSADTLLSTSVDATAFIIRVVLRTEGVISPQAKYPPLGAIRKAHILAQLYAAAEIRWMERLWLDCTFTVDADGQGCLFRTQESDWGENFCISELRRHIHKTELAFRTEQFWREARFSPYAEAVVKPRQQGKVLRLDFDSYQRSDNPPIELIWRMWAQEPYYDHILDEPVPAIAGATINQLISARLIVQAIGKAVLETLPSHYGLETADDLLLFAPVLSRSSIRDLVKQLTPELTREQANQILNLLTFGKDKETNSDLFTRPFIRLDEDRVLAFLAPILSGNLEREIETWLSRLNLIETDKGNAFEARVRDGVNQTANGSELAHFVEVFPASFRLKIGDCSEQIDLVARVGDKLLVGEIKCQFYPVGPIEISHHMQNLHRGCEQGARKAEFVSTNIEAAVRLSCFHVDVPLNRVEVIPVVITNHQFGVGTSHEGIPIIDLVGLLAFFNNVYYHHVQVKDNKALDLGYQLRFWNAPGDASQMLKQYLVCPPQIQILRSCKEEYVSNVPLASRPDKYYRVRRIRLNAEKVASLFSRPIFPVSDA
jgi:hypothetical protein